ncbi:phage tail sheath C-terminal domain-containing protein [Actinoplanes sp. NPDC049596]|uniref:phage tail sheath C-terminal domain-containing protein n=1 Tax=unclassified Actinoplanes TaxID=2626549 RepID=UPI00343EEBBD
MTRPLTPGVYRRPLEPIRTGGRLTRGDIPALLGYAARGPVGEPVRVWSVRQYEEVFGPARATGFLWHAVKGFFETGGRAAYIIRVATTAARPATVDLRPGAPFTWRAEASFPWLMIDPRRLSGAELAEAQGWVQVFERGLLAHGPRSLDPGGWGNGLAVRIARGSRVRTEVREVLGDGTAVRLDSLAGLASTSVLELTQDGAGDPEFRLPTVVDPVRRVVHWDRPPERLRLDRPIRVSSVEFDVTVEAGGRPEQTFLARAPHPDHPFALVATLAAECRSLTLRPVARDEVIDWADPATWPPEGSFALTGGADGLEDMDRATWLGVLSGVAGLDDAAMVAAPDLVLPDSMPAPAPTSPPAPVDCSDLTPRPVGVLAGVVTGAADRPLPGVAVDVAGPGGVATTGSDGRFTVTGVEVGLVTLRLRKDGYEPVELLVQTSLLASAEPVRLAMVRIVTPRALTSGEVLVVQTAMADPSFVGPYKVAFLDPPAAGSRLDEIATWRSRLGDTARIGFFAPWLTLPAGEGRLACPPSGHVCGAFAAGELAAGVHRTGANLPLRYVDGTTLAVGDEEQAGLNAAGINAIRAFPGRGIRVFGSRTLSSDPRWRFLTSRRVVDALERTLERALQWMVFEPNNLITRQAVTTTATTLLGMVHRDGVLAGATAGEAFAVRCDDENNPEAVQDAGQLVVDIAVAPADPYEFVVFRLGRTYDALDVTERVP